MLQVFAKRAFEHIATPVILAIDGEHSSGSAMTSAMTQAVFADCFRSVFFAPVACSNDGQVKLAKLCTTTFGKMLAAPFAVDRSHVKSREAKR